MKSPFLALLLIVNLLTCPMRCLSCESNQVAGEQCAPTACHCCSHTREAPVSQTPEPCGDDCHCHGCICEGAVVKADIEVPEPADAFVIWIWPAELGNHSAAVLNKNSTRRSRASTGQILCGRDVRVAHQSWLI